MGDRLWTPSRFQSTHPLRGATSSTVKSLTFGKFQSTHPLRGATRRTAAVRALVAISIHAPLAGCDLALCRELGVSVDISIHAPLAGCDISSDNTAWIFGEFQSTHPLRGATRWHEALLRHVLISIHAPLAGCDLIFKSCFIHSTDFNPRTPCGVRPKICGINVVTVKFQSTHPLRGATCDIASVQPCLFDFNPRTPCGVRRRTV